MLSVEDMDRHRRRLGWGCKCCTGRIGIKDRLRKKPASGISTGEWRVWREVACRCATSTQFQAWKTQCRIKRPALRLLISQPDGPENKQNRFCCGYGRKCMGIKGEDKRKLTACRLLVPLIMFEQRRYEDSENWAKSYAMVGRRSMVTGSVFVRLGCFHVDVNVTGPFLSSLKGGRRRGARRYHINHRNS